MPSQPSPLPQLPEPPPPTLRLKVDAAALGANWRALDRLSGSAAAGAAVKADAYGLGVDRVVPALVEAGCRDFFVAHVAEVPALLRHVAAERVGVFHGPLTGAEADYCRAVGVRPVLNSLAQVDRWRTSGGGRCDLMVDTGINRLGVDLSELADPALGGLDIDVCMSHLASADEDRVQNETQLARFAQARAKVRARRYSLANSAGIALGTAYHADLTRPGLALYGGIPRDELADVIAPVAELQAAVMQVREVSAGAALGYSATFVAPRSMRVGLISLGYADGYMRGWSSRGQFGWQGRDLPVLGRVSMDMTIIDLSSAPDCGEGDWVTAVYNPRAAAEATGLSQYEALTVLGKRFG